MCHGGRIRLRMTRIDLGFGLGLIRLRGHNPEGGYDVHNVRDETKANAAELY